MKGRLKAMASSFPMISQSSSLTHSLHLPGNSGSHVPFFLRLLLQSTDINSVASTHSDILKSGFYASTSSGNHLINAYLRCRAVRDAEKMFGEMPDRANVVSWTALMGGYVEDGLADKALALFSRMLRCEIPPNSFTISTAIKACSVAADVRTGCGVHARVEKSGFRDDVVVSTSLIDMYAKCNRVEDARLVFDGMADRNIVSWGSMISAYAQNAQGHQTLQLFREYLRLKLTPNHFIFSSAVNACASLGRLSAGKCVHAALIRLGHHGNDVIAGALVDMYAKCGCIRQSEEVFRWISCPTVVPYTSMIVSAAKHGLWYRSLNLFDEMLVRGVWPNEVTFVGVIHACSHSGLVDRGLGYLHSMHKVYGIKPSAKHYTCAVDMLGRAGRLDEAYNLSKDVRVKDDDALLLWTTLLSAGRKHGRLDIATEASKKLAEFNRDVAGAYVVMSNTYASVGNWGDAVRIRSEMKSRGIRKDPGCSWVEIRDVAYVFYAGNLSSCEREDEVLNKLKELEVKMRERGYVERGNGMVFHGVEEEEARAIMVGMHSERLALAFGLISTPKGVTIRVMKNLRICCDCHEVFKMISEIVNRSFVVRDLNRFHHFTGGSCTCGDYW